MLCLNFVLAFCISCGLARPQIQPPAQTQNEDEREPVVVERQLLHEVIPLDSMADPPNVPHSAQRQIDENTKEILEKIADVNKKQGLVQKKPKPSYFHFPFSYSRSQDPPKGESQFKFSRDPFSNPILDYLERGDDGKTSQESPSFRRPNYDSEHHSGAFGGGFTDTNPEILPEDIVPGQYIKRKVTHVQSFAMPSPYMFNGYTPGQNPAEGPVPNNFYYRPPSQQANYASPLYSTIPINNKTKSQQQAIDTIKEILSKYSSYNQEYQQPQYNLPPLPQIAPGDKNGRQNWNWPGANLFPIYIRDPFLQMYYAVTNMIEYGPNSGSDGPCKLTPRPQGSRVKTKPTNRDSGQHLGQQVTLEINKREGTDEVTVVNVEEPEARGAIPYLDVADIDLEGDDFVKFTINLPPEPVDGRNFKSGLKSDKMGWPELLNAQNNTHLKVPVGSKQTPQIVRQTLEVADIPSADDPPEEEKAENIRVGNEGSRKVFSKDNTGNGIFIQKLRVRQGGVAIAGPGGIATAGSGGTAIVGPNGVAYTHPDGLAIAGSGTKVVAVDPAIDLNEVIKNTVLNGTRHVPNTRVGKVVAVGPVVYYNRGNT